MENGRFQVAFQLGGKVSLGFPLPRTEVKAPPEAPRRGNSGAMAPKDSRRSSERVGPNIAVHRCVIRQGRAAIDAATHPANRLAGEEAPASAMA